MFGLDTYFDYFEQFFWTIHSAYREFVKKLDCKLDVIRHKTNGLEGKIKHIPIKPLNRLKVLGILTCGLTSMRTPFAV